MKELLRFQQVSYNSGRSHALKNYNLTVNKGEILFLMGLSGSGKTHVMDLIQGAVVPHRGHIYMEEVPIPTQQLSQVLNARVRTIGAVSQMVQNFSIMDNLASLTYQSSVWKAYSKKNHARVVEEALEQTGIQATPQTRTSKLSFVDQQKLAILNACAGGADLVVINCIFQEYGGTDLLELGRYMTQLSQQGVSFLVVSEKPNDLIRVAHRFQIIHRGMDVREWPAGSDDMARLVRYTSDLPSHPVRNPDEQIKAPIIEITDTGWVAGIPARDMMAAIRQNSPQVWKEHIDVPIPPSGTYHANKTVWIPQESGELFSNLSIQDNLTLCIRKKSTTFGLIRRHSQRFLLGEFQNMLGLAPTTTKMSQLDKIEHKILSIHRWVLFRPHTIVLETPFWGLDLKDMERMRQYIRHISSAGVRVILLTKTAWENGSFCDLWIRSSHGRAFVMEKPTTDVPEIPRLQ